MLPIRRTVAIPEGEHRCVVLIELSLVRRFLSRASGKMRNLFPVIPHYWILRRNLPSHRSWLAGANIDVKDITFRYLS